MQVHFPRNIRIRNIRPRLEAMRLQPFVNIDNENFAKPTLNGFWRLEMSLMCATVQEHLALSSFLIQMRGAGRSVIPVTNLFLPEWRANKPMNPGGEAPVYAIDHTGFSGEPFDGFTLHASASHRDSYIDVDKPETVQLWPGHFITIDDRLYQVVNVSAIDEREDRIRVSVMPNIRGDHDAGTLVVVDQLQLSCMLESAGDVELWNIPHSEVSAVFVEAF